MALFFPKTESAPSTIQNHDATDVDFCLSVPQGAQLSEKVVSALVSNTDQRLLYFVCGFRWALHPTTGAQKRFEFLLRYLCLKPPPDAISAIARDQKKPEERRESTRARSGQNGPALDALAASGKHAGAMDGERENSALHPITADDVPNAADGGGLHFFTVNDSRLHLKCDPL